MAQLKEVLSARSVAVVGASGKSGKIGHTLLHNLILGGYSGAIYPVNLREETLLGLKCYPSLSAIPGEVELLVLCVPAALTVEILEQAQKKGTRGAIVISGGFQEIGNASLGERLLATARTHHIQLIGPNCQGVYCASNSLCATWPLITQKGTVGIVSQSGTIGAEIGMLCQQDGIGVSCFAALGNKADVSEADFLDYLAEDPDTKVIALNIEGIQDSAAFIPAVLRAVENKPVVVLKPGRTPRGIQAVASHTKSVVGNDKLFSVFCKKYGLMRADNITEFYDFTKMAACIERPLGDRLLILTSSGGAGILATDAAEENGLDVTPLPRIIRDALKQSLPAQCVINNPLDLTGDASAARYTLVLQILEQTVGEYDTVLIVFGDPIPGAYDTVKKARERLNIPLVVSYLGGGAVQAQEVERMQTDKIPVFPTPERAIRAIHAFTRAIPYRKER